MARTYPDPWVPRTFSAWITKQSRPTQRTTDRVTGAVVRSESTAGTWKGGPTASSG